MVFGAPGRCRDAVRGPGRCRDAVRGPGPERGVRDGECWREVRGDPVQTLVAVAGSLVAELGEGLGEEVVQPGQDAARDRVAAGELDEVHGGARLSQKSP